MIRGNKLFCFRFFTQEEELPTMAKRIIALILCLTACVAVFAGCAGSIDPTDENKGQQITMYLTENVYDLDPAHAYINESTRSVVSLLFDTLFILDENGKVKPSLAESYTVEEKIDKSDASKSEYYMYITLKDTNWSDNTPISADDVVFAWKRALSYNNSSEAAALLYDIKGARDYIKGDVSEDDIGLTADNKTVTIQFEGKIDYDQFILNLTSLMLAPLRESVVSKSDDWAKKPGTMVCSGPYKLSRISFSENSENRYTDPNFDEKKTVDGSTSFVEGVGSITTKENLVNCFILERNSYYYRDSEKDQKLDVSVKPYRIVVDCGMPEEDIKEAFDKGVIQYMGDIPYSLRDDFASYDVELKDSLSTATCYFNQNADINGTKLFSIPEVRQALSLAIDRKAIANAVVYAEAATGLVPTGVFDTNSAKSLFRDNANGSFEFLATDANKAATLLANANVDPEDYSFSLTVAAYDDVHVAIGEAIVASWCALGFDVELKKVGTIVNNDYYKPVNDIPTDICDDIYAEDVRGGRYEVALIDLVAISADPFSVLAPFAKEFSGQSMDMSSSESYELTPHITGYDNPDYSAIIEAVYNNKTAADRSAKLHEAEAQLMKDMPVVPVIFNKTATLVGDGLKLNNKTLFWKKTSNYYGADTLKYVSVKDYDEYITAGASFLESKFDAYKELKTSYFSGEAFILLSFEEFKEESSNFAFFFPKPVEDEKK